MYNKSINTKKSNFLKILKKRKSNNILNKFSKINLNLLTKNFVIILVIIIGLFIIYINISYFELIGDYQYYDDYLDTEPEYEWDAKKRRLHYEKITDKELDKALEFFTTSYDERTKNMSSADRLYNFRRKNLKPTLADYFFWSKFNLIQLTEQQYILLDKLIFEKIGNHKLKDLTEQEMSFIWHAYRLGQNEEVLRGVLNFYFHSPSIQRTIFTYPSGGGRAFWLKYVANVNTVMSMGFNPEEMLMERILSKQAPFYTWRYQGIPLFDSWEKHTEALQAFEIKKYVEKKYPLASIDEYKKKYKIGKDINEKVWEAMQHNPLPFIWNLKLNWNLESENKIELIIHGPKWQWKPTNIKPDILINHVNLIKEHYEQSGDIPIKPTWKKDDLVIIFAPCNLTVELKNEPSLTVDPLLIKESVMDKVTAMNFIFPKKSKFNSDDLHNLDLLERTIKKKVIIIFIEPHNTLLRLAGGFNLFEEFLTTDNIFFLKPLTYDQQQELARVKFCARLKVGWERKHIAFSPKWEKKLIEEYTQCWEIFSKKWADDEEIQTCLLVSEGWLFLGRTTTYVDGQPTLRWHYPWQPYYSKTNVFSITSGSLDGANFSIFHKAISHYPNPELIPREAIIEWTKAYTSFDHKWIKQVIKDRPDSCILQIVKKPIPPPIINVEENLNEKNISDEWWESVKNNWAEDIPVNESLGPPSIPPDDTNIELKTNKQWIVYTNFIKDQETFMQILLFFFKSPDALAFTELKGLITILSISFGCFMFCLRFIWGLFKWCCIIIIWFLLFSLISFFCVWFTQVFAKLYEIIKLKKNSLKIKTTSKMTALTLITYYFRPDIEEDESSLRSEFYKILSSILGPKGWFYRDGTIWIERLCIKFNIIQKPPIYDKWHTLWSPLMRNGELVYIKTQKNLIKQETNEKKKN